MAAAAPPLTANATLRWSIVRPILDEIRPARVLEIGCGLGGFGARIAGRADYVGVETDRESYEVARGRVERLGGRVVHGTVEALDEPDPFDLVCAFEVIEHIEDDVAALNGWRSRLAPGGTIVVSVPAWPDRFGPSDRMAGHYRRYTPGQLDATLLAAGYHQPVHVLYGWPLGFATEPVRHVVAQRVLDRRQQSMEERTASSGRFLQHDGVVGHAIMAAAAPFGYIQKLQPTKGVGLVGVARG